MLSVGGANSCVGYTICLHSPNAVNCVCVNMRTVILSFVRCSHISRKCVISECFCCCCHCPLIQCQFVISLALSFHVRFFGNCLHISIWYRLLKRLTLSSIFVFWFYIEIYMWLFRYCFDTFSFLKRLLKRANFLVVRVPLFFGCLLFLFFHFLSARMPVRVAQSPRKVSNNRCG